jgi:hypothetical protein
MVNQSAAVVLDLSVSAISSGERLYHPAALGLALVGLLEQCLGQVTVFQVGGSSPLNGRRIPRPVGPTDLATAVLEAARTEPQAILIVSDGYENCRQGDVAQVVEGLHRLGMAKVVYQVVPVFTAAENLSKRRLGENVPLLAVGHEACVDTELGVIEHGARKRLFPAGAGHGETLSGQETGGRHPIRVDVGDDELTGFAFD